MLFNKVSILYSKLEKLFKVDGREISFLVFFRVAISTIALIEITSLYVDLPLFFSSSSTLIPQELMYLESGDFRFLNPFYNFLESNGLTHFFYRASVPVYLLSLVFLLFGLLTRYAAFMALILQLIIFRSFGPFNYGYDFFLTMSLFYCIVFPVGNYFSLDSKLFKKLKDVRINYRRIIQIHLIIAYFFSGISKGLSIGWWNGNSVWKAIASLDNSYYSFYPLILTIVGIGTVLLEFCYPFLILRKSIRQYVLLAVILMHVSIAVMMELYAFSTIMIVWNLAAYGNLTIIDKKVSDVETV